MVLRRTILAIRPCALLIIHIVGRRRPDLHKTAAADLDELKHQDGSPLAEKVQTAGGEGRRRPGGACQLAAYLPLLLPAASCQLSNMQPSRQERHSL